MMPQRRPSRATSAPAAISIAAGCAVGEVGDEGAQRPPPHLGDLGEQHVECEPDGQVEDDADHGRGDRGEHRLERAIPRSVST